MLQKKSSHREQRKGRRPRALVEVFPSVSIQALDSHSISPPPTRPSPLFASPHPRATPHRSSRRSLGKERRFVLLLLRLAQAGAAAAATHRGAFRRHLVLLTDHCARVLCAEIFQSNSPQRATAPKCSSSAAPPLLEFGGLFGHGMWRYVVDFSEPILFSTPVHSTRREHLVLCAMASFGLDLDSPLLPNVDGYINPTRDEDEHRSALNAVVRGGTHHIPESRDF